jgi:prepilin-type processing-associated H-X9-DG protein
VAFARRLSKVFKTVAGSAEPAVVHITSLNRVRYRRDFFDRVGQEQIVPNGLGSGLIVSADGYILTNHHVVKQADKLTVKLGSGEEVDARIINTASPSGLYGNVGQANYVFADGHVETISATSIADWVAAAVAAPDQPTFAMPDAMPRDRR